MHGGFKKEENNMKISKEGKGYISKKIKILVEKEHFPQQKAIAAAYSMARKKGFKIPKYKR